MSQIVITHHNKVEKHFYNEIKPKEEPPKVVSTLYVKPVVQEKEEFTKERVDPDFGDNENVITEEEMPKEEKPEDIKPVKQPKKKMGRPKKVNG
jgi:hypothetical protein